MLIVVILVVLFVSISVVSFVMSEKLSNDMKKRKDKWFSIHSEDENALISQYLEYVNTKEKKSKKASKSNEKN